MLCTLVMTSPTFDVDAFLASHPHLPVAKAWRRGESIPGRRRRVTEEAGLVVELAEADDWPELSAGAYAAVERFRPVVKAAQVAGADVEVDFGVAVGVDGHFTYTARFEVADLRRFADLGVRVLVTAYPG